MSATALLNGTPQPERRRYRRRHGGQHLPLRHLCPHPRRHPCGCDGLGGCDHGTRHAIAPRRSSTPALVAGGGLMLGLRLPSLARAAEPDGPFEPNAFVRIDPQGPIIFIMPHAEVGQGIYTARRHADRRGTGGRARPDPRATRAARRAKYIDPILGDQATGGSSSIRGDWMRLRQAGAAARIMLIARRRRNAGASIRGAAVPSAASCSIPRAGARSATATLAAAAAAQPVPQPIPLKDRPRSSRLIGTSAKRLDTPSKVNGTARVRHRHQGAGHEDRHAGDHSREGRQAGCHGRGRGAAGARRARRDPRRR